MVLRGVRTGGRKGCTFEEGGDEAGDVKCRARTPARNCSLRFSREDLGLRDLLDCVAKAKPSRNRDNFRSSIK